MSSKMGKLQEMHDKLFKFTPWLQTPFLFLIRLYWGALFFQHGMNKFHDFPGTVGFFEGAQIPLPTVSAFLAASAEYFGGMCLMLGLGSRLVSVPLAFTMMVAYVSVHADMLSFGEFQKASPATFLLVTLMILIWGPGKISLDHLIRWVFSKVPEGAPAPGGGGGGAPPKK